MMVKVKDLSIEGERGKPCWQCKKLLSIDIPLKLEDQRSEIIKDLEAAFTAHRGVGILAAPDYYSSYKFTLEV